MLLPTTLLTTNQVYQMMDRLNSEFRPNADYTVISNVMITYLYFSFKSFHLLKKSAFA